MIDEKYSDHEIIYLVGKFKDGCTGMIDFCQTEELNVYEFKRWLSRPCFVKDESAGVVVGEDCSKGSKSERLQRSFESNNFICFKIADEAPARAKATLIKKSKLHALKKAVN